MSRYIFFLADDENRLRSVGDVFDYRLPVFSGRHDDDPSLRDAPLQEAIARILLTPGTEYQADPCFVDGTAITLSEYYLTSKAHTIQLLEKSLSHPDVKVRVCACSQLAKHFPTRTKCLYTLLEDPEVERAVRRAIREQLNRMPRERVR